MRSRAALGGFLSCAALAVGPASCLCWGPDCDGDSASLTLRSREGRWTAGLYEITISAAGKTFRCTAVAPEDFGARDPVPCSPRLDVLIRSEHDAGTVTGYYFSVLGVPGEPESVTVVMKRDGVELLNERRSFDYQTFEERSSVCGGDCRKANVELTVDAGSP